MDTPEDTLSPCPHCGEPWPAEKITEPARWTRATIAAVDDFQPDPPLSQLWTAWRSDMKMEALVWGDGSPQEPFSVLIRARVPDSPSWFPSWFDCCDLLHQLADPGAFFQAAPFEIQKDSPATILEQLKAGGWAAIQFVQTGVRPGSPAQRKAGLIHRPNFKGNHGQPRH